MKYYMFSYHHTTHLPLVIITASSKFTCRSNLPASLRWEEEDRDSIWKRKKLSLNAFNRKVPRGYIFYCFSISFIAPLAIPFGSVIKVCTTAPCLSETTSSRLRFLFPNGWRKRHEKRVFSSQTSYHIDGSTDFGMRLQLTVTCILSPHRQYFSSFLFSVLLLQTIACISRCCMEYQFSRFAEPFRPWAVRRE